jgi:hypothetical protein
MDRPRIDDGRYGFIFGCFITAIALLGSSTLTQAEPLHEPVLGPKLVCFKYSTFLLGEGEKIIEFTGSPEGMSVTVEGATGTFRIGESEIFAPVKGHKRLVASRGQTKIYRVPSGGGRYAIYGPTTFSDGKDQLVIWLSGDNLRGKSSDRATLDRFEIRDPASVRCEQTFTYSWDFILGTRPHASGQDNH